MLDPKFAALLGAHNFIRQTPNQEYNWMRRLTETAQDMYLHITPMGNLRWNAQRRDAAIWLPSRMTISVSGLPNAATVKITGKNKIIANLPAAIMCAVSLAAIHSKKDKEFKKAAMEIMQRFG